MRHPARPALLVLVLAGPPRAPTGPAPVRANDDRRPAGTLRDGVPSRRLDARLGASAPRRPAQAEPAAARRRLLSIGETADVEVTPTAPAELRLEARTALGVVLGTLPIRGRP